MLDQKEERKRFEARVLLRRPDASFAMKKGRYIDRTIQLRWAGWLDKAHDGVPPPPVRDETSSVRPWCNTWRAQNGYPVIKENTDYYEPIGSGQAPKPSILKGVFLGALGFSVSFTIGWTLAEVFK